MRRKYPAASQRQPARICRLCFDWTSSKLFFHTHRYWYYIKMAQVEPISKKTRTDKGTVSAMKTLEDFEERWGTSITIAHDPTWSARFLTWNLNNDEQLRSVRDFIVQAARKWSPNVKGFLNPVTNESSLYHFITDVIMSVAELNNCRVMRSEPPVEELTQEMLQNAAEVVAQRNSRQSTRSNSVEGNSKVTTTPATTEVSGTGRTFDDTNPNDIAALYLAIERQIQSDIFNTGHVEIAIVKETVLPIKKASIQEAPNLPPREKFMIRNDEVCAVEVKPTIVTDATFDAAFYQCCSYMGAMFNRANHKPDVMYGIATDYQHWVFLRLDRSPDDSEAPHIRFSQRIPFAAIPKRGPKGLAVTAPIVIAYLFEICGVPLDTNLMASMHAAAYANEKFCEEFTSEMVEVCNSSANYETYKRKISSY